jgi:hypothetical protein
MSTIRIPNFGKEDLPGLIEAEPRFEGFLSAFNQLAKQLESIVNGGIGSQNLNAQRIELEVAKSQPYPIKVALRIAGKPGGVRLLGALKTTTKREGEPAGVAVGVDWGVDGSTLLINGLPGIDAAQSYRVTLEVVGG